MSNIDIVTVNRFLHCDGSSRKVRVVTITPMTTTLRVTEVYPEITVADAHPERGQTQERPDKEDGDVRNTARERPDTEDGGVKDTAGRSRGGAKEHSRETLRE